MSKKEVAESYIGTTDKDPYPYYEALRKTGGNKKAAADMLRLKRTTLSAKVRSLEPVA